MPSERRYLVEEREREHMGVQALVNLPIVDRILAPLGLNASFSWFILRLQKRRLLSSLTGDIDLLAGPLAWNDSNEFLSELEKEKKVKQGWSPGWIELSAALKLANRGGIRWPPPISHLVALEAKCMYLDPSAKGDVITRESFKSTKTSPQKTKHTRGQVNKLLTMGFDRVALLDIIANPPSTGDQGAAWLSALGNADRSAQAMRRDLANRLPGDSPAGHYVWSVGAVVGGDESRRGAGAPRPLRLAIQNPFLLKSDETKAHRNELEVNLIREFEKIAAPLHLRFVFEDCGKCRTIHYDLADCNERMAF